MAALWVCLRENNWLYMAASYAFPVKYNDFWWVSRQPKSLIQCSQEKSRLIRVVHVTYELICNPEYSYQHFVGTRDGPKDSNFDTCSWKPSEIRLHEEPVVLDHFLFAGESLVAAIMHSSSQRLLFVTKYTKI